MQKETHDPVATREKRRQNHVARLRIMVRVSIARHIAKVTGKYCELSVPDVWEAIKEKCGYDIHTLVSHIESQFTPKMNWQNQITPRNKDQYGWHMDHIVPHASYSYDSLDHPDFVECWALENLRPIDAITNMKLGASLRHLRYKQK